MNTARTAANRDDWLAARLALLAREKELSRLSDQIARERRALPWVRMDKHYVFDSPQGPRTLADLFDGRGQLLVQHFMFGPGWVQGCSYMADHSDGMRPPWRRATRRWWRCRARRWPRSRPFAGAWAGASPGCPRTAAISTATSA